MASRRDFLKVIGLGGAAVGAIAALPPTTEKAMEITHHKPDPTLYESKASGEIEVSLADEKPSFSEPAQEVYKFDMKPTRTIIIANGHAVTRDDNGKFRVVGDHTGKLLTHRQLAEMYT